MTSCYDEPIDESLKNGANQNRYEGGIQLENPYATVNMKIALDTIKAKVERGI
ncbi:hypothetical protein [uncultured Winogradskyella sp.]|uniref:hypothetical protein n=1 Tax=uncultured Winogradskyella sp. TaxID=395353 RepID=UPI002638C5FF|nr:hypothetical protein [uncultured Winogradskyella sp.]